jgi:hypothetical protein
MHAELADANRNDLIRARDALTAVIDQWGGVAR